MSVINSVKETAPNPYDGAEFRHPVQSHRQGVIAGKYGGGVFCNLPDGVTVMCNYSFHYDDASFRSGDRVMLIIQRYDDNGSDGEDAIYREVDETRGYGLFLHDAPVKADAFN